MCYWQKTLSDTLSGGSGGLDRYFAAPHGQYVKLPGQSFSGMPALVSVGWDAF